MTHDEMPADLEWLARNVSEWPENAYWGAWLTSREGSSFHGWPQYMPPLHHKAYLRTEWLQARQLLGLDNNAATPEEEEEGQAMEEKQADMVNNPPHYTQGGIECIDAIKAALTPEEFRGFCKGNAIKYVWRELHKGGDESLRKADWYIASALRAGELGE